MNFLNAAIFNDAIDPIIIEDLNGNIIQMNPVAEKTYGWNTEDLRGKPIKTIVPPERHGQADDLFRRCKAGETVRDVEGLRLNREGHIKPVLISLSLLKDKKGVPAGIATIVKDISERKNAEHEIIDLALSLNQATNIHEIMIDLRKRILELSQANDVLIYYIDHQKNQLVTRMENATVFQEVRMPISNESIAGYTATTKKTVKLKDGRDPDELKKYPGLQYNDALEKKAGVRVYSILSAPILFNRTGLQGVIQLINSRAEEGFTDEDEEYLKTVGKAIAVALFNIKDRSNRQTQFDLLLNKNIITEDDLSKAFSIARKTPDHPINGDVASILVNQFDVPEEKMGASLSRYYLVDFMGFSESVIVQSDLLEGINRKYLQRNLLLPFAKEGETLFLLMDNPFDRELVEEFREAFAVRNCELYVGLREDILKYIDRAYSGRAPTKDIDAYLHELDDGERHELGDGERHGWDDRESVEETEPDVDILDETAPVIVRTTNKIIVDAFEKGVSDIHVEPYDGQEPTWIRFRKDGVCFDYTKIPANHKNALVNRIKIMAGLKIDDRRFPQSGKVKLRYGKQDIELRVECTPTVGSNEDVVLRILSSGRPLTMDQLNLSERNFNNMTSMINQPYGIILAVGPTGSGKTTTLHSILSQLNTREKKIWTAEDPVEITQRGLRQVQVNPRIKPEPFDFPKAMRSFLRADPDIIMVGEMRDRETVNIAVEASLTGHLVLSTLHTNSSVETVTRLVQVGTDPILLADGLLGVLAQRLVRVLCEECKEKYQPDQSEYQQLSKDYGESFQELDLQYDEKFHLFRPVGCSKCHNTGFLGRTGIHELMVATTTIKEMIAEKASTLELKKQALAEGMRTLKMDGIEKVIKGQTTFREVMKVCIQ
ncbi:ATPase, T2SS/T4P/T4SS family [Thermodesulfobacteriota bacterium]